MIPGVTLLLLFFGLVLTMKAIDDRHNTLWPLMALIILGAGGVSLYQVDYFFWNETGTAVETHTATYPEWGTVFGIIALFNFALFFTAYNDNKTLDFDSEIKQRSDW